MKIKKFKNQKFTAGFTMIEAFVAITVLLVAVLGPLTLLTRAINDGNYAKYQVVASFLLQEGLDLAIARGAEAGNGASDIESFGVGCTDVNPCRIYSFNDANGTVTLDHNSDFYLYTDTNGVYSHDVGGTKTFFQRKIWFENLSDVQANRMTEFWNAEDPENLFDVHNDVIGRKVFVQIDWAYKGLTKTQLATTIVYE